MASIYMQREDITSLQAGALISDLNTELSDRYPEPGANHFRLDADEVAPGQGAFFIVYEDDQALGCCAIRRLDDNTAEIKRMFVKPSARGRGVGYLMLRGLEAEAQRLQVKQIVLETGTRQAEAIALYEKSGFISIPRFGEYRTSELSYGMAKTLA